ncbi:hypothetical protein PO002_05500 [Cupriavidus necator]|uniref:hypothetical protein n=1 Tax=Cupriavidus necator TaxID=106590 RepID=UPI0039C31151
MDDFAVAAGKERLPETPQSNTKKAASAAFCICLRFYSDLSSGNQAFAVLFSANADVP